MAFSKKDRGFIQKRKTIAARQKKIRVKVSAKRSPGKKVLAYKPDFKRYLKENPVLFEVRGLINSHMQDIKAGKTVFDANKNITILKAATGNFKGNSNIITLKVKVKNREFFVKLTKGDTDIKKVLKAIQRADKLLKKVGYRVGTMNVRAIMPHFAYGRYPGRNYLVTDFFNAGEVVPCNEIKGKLGTKISKNFEDVKEMLEKKELFRDLHSFNAFYHKKTNTILLFDLNLW